MTSSAAPVLWESRDSITSKWIPYDLPTCAALETVYATAIKGGKALPVKILIGGKTGYAVDVVKMVQVNPRGLKRPIRRSAPAAAAAPASKSSSAANAGVSPSRVRVVQTVADARAQNEPLSKITALMAAAIAEAVKAPQSASDESGVRNCCGPELLTEVATALQAASERLCAASRECEAAASAGGGVSQKGDRPVEASLSLTPLPEWKASRPLFGGASKEDVDEAIQAREADFLEIARINAVVAKPATKKKKRDEDDDGVDYETAESLRWKFKFPRQKPSIDYKGPPVREDLTFGPSVADAYAGKDVATSPPSTNRAFLVHRFFSPVECEWLIEQVRDKYTSVANIFPQDHRVSDRFMAKDHAVAAEIFRRVRLHLRCSDYEGRIPLCFGQEGQWYPVSCNECLKFVRYPNDGYFGLHRDGPWIPSEDVASIFTIVVYLNDDFDGGETTFFPASAGARMRDISSNASVIPVQGTALIFNHDAWHTGNEPRGAEKHILRTEIVFRRVRTLLVNRFQFTTDAEYRLATELYRLSKECNDAGDLHGFIALYQHVVAMQQAASARDTAAVSAPRSLPLLFPIVGHDVVAIVADFLPDASLPALLRVSRSTFYTLSASSAVWQVRCYSRYPSVAPLIRHGKDGTDWYQVFKQQKCLEKRFLPFVFCVHAHNCFEVAVSITASAVNPRVEGGFYANEVSLVSDDTDNGSFIVLVPQGTIALDGAIKYNLFHAPTIATMYTQYGSRVDPYHMNLPDGWRFDYAFSKDDLHEEPAEYDPTTMLSRDCYYPEDHGSDNEPETEAAAAEVQPTEGDRKPLWGSVGRIIRRSRSLGGKLKIQWERLAHLIGVYCDVALHPVLLILPDDCDFTQAVAAGALTTFCGASAFCVMRHCELVEAVKSALSGEDLADPSSQGLLDALAAPTAAPEVHRATLMKAAICWSRSDRFRDNCTFASLI